MSDEVKIGQQHVEQLLGEIALTHGVQIERAYWVESPDGFTRGFELLVVTAGTRQFRERFGEINLEDCQSTPAVQSLLRNQVLGLVRRVKAELQSNDQSPRS